MWSFNATFVYNGSVVQAGILEDEHGFRLLTEHDTDLPVRSALVQKMLGELGCASKEFIDPGITEMTFNLSGTHGRGIINIFTTPDRDVHVNKDNPQVVLHMFQSNFHFLNYFKASPTLETYSLRLSEQQVVKGGKPGMRVIHAKKAKQEPSTMVKSHNLKETLDEFRSHLTRNTHQKVSAPVREEQVMQKAKPIEQVAVVPVKVAVPVVEAEQAKIVIPPPARTILTEADDDGGQELASLLNSLED